MAITTLQQIKDIIPAKVVAGAITTPGSTAAGVWFCYFGVNTFNGTNAAIGNTANGRVPTQATTGFPPLPSFGGNLGFIARAFMRMQGGGPVFWRLYDRVFDAGVYAFDANVTLASQPSFLSRIPGGTAADCAGETEIWMEGQGTTTLNQSVTVGYTNQAGTAGRSTGAVSFGTTANTRRMFPMPLQAGDLGVSQINTIQGTVSTAGATSFNVAVMRRIASGRLHTPHSSEDLDLLRTCQVPFNDQAALYLIIKCENGINNSPGPNIDADIVWG